MQKQRYDEFDYLWVVENGYQITKVYVDGYRSGRYLVVFPGGWRAYLPESRLFESEEAAKESIRSES